MIAIAIASTALLSSTAYAESESVIPIGKQINVQHHFNFHSDVYMQLKKAHETDTRISVKTQLDNQKQQYRYHQFDHRSDSYYQRKERS
jgi:hypothetical protein